MGLVRAADDMDFFFFINSPLLLGTVSSKYTELGLMIGCTFDVWYNRFLMMYVPQALCQHTEMMVVGQDGPHEPVL